MNSVIDLIKHRVSSPRLVYPAPNSAQLEEILACALRAPDHARLRPWQYHVISGDGLNKLGEIFAQTAKHENASKDKIEKCRNMPKRAPLLIVAVCEPKESAKVPKIEQLLAVGAGIQNMQLAISSLGYGSIWRTGDMAHSQMVKQYLGVTDAGEIVGFLYVGTPERQLQKPKVLQSDFVKYWD